MDYCGMYFDLLSIQRRAAASREALTVRERTEFLEALRGFRDYCWEAMAWAA